MRGEMRVVAVVGGGSRSYSVPVFEKELARIVFRWIVVFDCPGRRTE